MVRIPCISPASKPSPAARTPTSPGPVTTILQKTDAEGFSGIGPVAFRGVDILTVAPDPGATLRDRTEVSAVDWTVDATPGYSDGSHILALTGYRNLVGGQGVD